MEGRQGSARFLGNNAETRRVDLTPRPRHHPRPPPTPHGLGIPGLTLRRPGAPHPAAPAGASGVSARPSWGPAPSGWTSSRLHGSFERTSRRRKPVPRRRGTRLLSRTSHCIGSGPARVARANLQSPSPPPQPLQQWLRRESRGEGQEGGVKAKRRAPPSGRCQSAPRARRTCARSGPFLGARPER